MNKNNNSTLVFFALSLTIIFFFISKQIFFISDENNFDKKNSINSTIPYLNFVNYVEQGWVKKIDFYDNSKVAIIETTNPELGDRLQKIRVEIPANNASLIEKLKKYSVDINAHATEENYFNSKILNASSKRILIIVSIIGLLLIYVLSQKTNENNSDNSNRNQLLNLRQTNLDIQVTPFTGVDFNDIAGIDEVKQDVTEIVSFINEPTRFNNVGAVIPKGILLVGPPGTGKTLLAKAIAGEAEVSFINISGSEFIEMFVGVGASRVRDLFIKAKENAPCIIFIDEIDAVARQRGVGIGGGNDEREQTLNQLLTEIDGFEKNSGIIVIAATNRVDILDNALLRPGRFDRQISVNSPDKSGREAILKIHAKDKKLSPDVCLEVIAQRTPGLGGAELANVLNEAALITARKQKESIGIVEINNAIERVIAGLERNSIIDSKNKRLVAYHEAGHAITATLLQSHDSVQTLSLVPRGQARGLTWFIPNDDPSIITRSQIMSKIIGALSGKAAEKVVFGNSEVTTGCSGDLRQVTEMVKQMVIRFGMSPIGPVALNNSGGGFVFIGSGVKPANEYSASLATKIDSQIRAIVELCYKEALQVIELNRVSLDKVVSRLMDYELLDGSSFEYDICSYSKLPIYDVYTTKI